MHTFSKSLVSVVMLAALSTTAVAREAPATWDGLELQTARGLDRVYLRPGSSLLGYKQVALDAPVEVAFDKNWDPNADVPGASGRLTAEDLQGIKDQMSAEFHKAFADELAKAGYAVVETVDDHTLLVNAALAEVHINAPDRMQPGRSTTYTMESGRMTLEMELRDGPTGQLLARIVDEKIGGTTGQFQVTNSATNSADFRRAVRYWAQRLVKALDQVNGRG